MKNPYEIIFIFKTSTKMSFMETITSLEYERNFINGIDFKETVSLEIGNNLYTAFNPYGVEVNIDKKSVALKLKQDCKYTDGLELKL